MRIIPTIPFCNADSWLAEQLLSWIYRLNGREPHPHCLLVAAHDCHDEIKYKLRLSAEVAFDNVELIHVPEIKTGNKSYKINQTIKTASQHIFANYRCPWLWLEPDCMPLAPDWLERLQLAYDAQPKRYLAGQQDWGTKEAPRLCMARQAVYPADALKDIEPLCGTNAPFEQNGGKSLLAKSGRTRLIQQAHEWTPETKIRTDAVILHRDESADLIRVLRAKLPDVLKADYAQAT